MKRALWIIIVALLAGLVGFVISRRPGTSITPVSPASMEAHSALPELEWLRREFKLTDAQFSKVSDLHVAYRPTCEAMCAKVIASNEKVKKLAEAGTQVSPELRAALAEHAALHVECQAAMIDHLYQTAACLSPDQARDYLDAMLPQAIEMTMEPEPRPGSH